MEIVHFFLKNLKNNKGIHQKTNISEQGPQKVVFEVILDQATSHTYN